MYMATLSAGCYDQFVQVNPFLTTKHLLFLSRNTPMASEEYFVFPQINASPQCGHVKVAGATT